MKREVETVIDRKEKEIAHFKAILKTTINDNTEILQEIKEVSEQNIKNGTILENKNNEIKVAL